MKNKNGNEIGAKVLTHGVLISGCIITLAPLAWLLMNSLKTNQEMMQDSLALPEELQFGNYVSAWNLGLFAYFKNSLIVSFISLVCIILLSALLTYGLTRFRSKGTKYVLFIILAGMCLSEQVALVPLFKILKAVKLYDTYLAVILPYIAFRIPFTVLLMRSYFLAIPRELEEAAVIDGCNSFQIFWRIILPVTRPVLASSAIINLNSVWNEFLFANVFLERKALMTIPIGLMTFKGDLKQEYTVMLAGIAIASIPMILLFMVMQKQFIKGLTAGAVKG